MIRRIRQSQLTQVRECRRKWELEYVRGLELARMPGETKGARDLGTLVHKLAEAYYKAEDWRAVLAHERTLLGDFPEWNDHLNMAEIMFTGYIEWLANEAADNGLVPKMIEPNLEHSMGVFHGDEVILTGKPDLVVWNTMSEAFEVHDTKTTTKIESVIIHGAQLKSYALLLKLQHGIDVSMGVTNQLKKVKRTARATPPFYGRSTMVINTASLQHHAANIMGQLDEMVELMQYWEQEGDRNRAVYDTKFYPSPTMMCPTRCDYLAICKTMDAGLDHERVIQFNYRHKPETDFQEVADSE